MISNHEQQKARPVRRRRARIRLTADFLRKVLMLPAEIEIESVDYNAERRVISLILAGERYDIPGLRLYDCAEGQEIPDTSPDVWELISLS